jgi:hypothetical protein
MAYSVGDNQAGTRGAVFYGDAYDVTGATDATGTITLTIGTHDIEVNEQVFVADVGGYDDLKVQAYTVTASDTTTISFKASATGTYTSGGSVQRSVGITNIDQSDGTDSVSVRDSNTNRDSNGLLWDDKVATSRTASFSFTAHKRAGVAFPLEIGQTYTIALYDNLWPDGDNVSGEAIVENVNKSGGIDSAITISVDASWKGAPTFTNGTAF